MASRMMTLCSSVEMGRLGLLKAHKGIRGQKARRGQPVPRVHKVHKVFKEHRGFPVQKALSDRLVRPEPKGHRGRPEPKARRDNPEPKVFRGCRGFPAQRVHKGLSVHKVRREPPERPVHRDRPGPPENPVLSDQPEPQEPQGRRVSKENPVLKVRLVCKAQPVSDWCSRARCPRLMTCQWMVIPVMSTLSWIPITCGRGKTT